MAPSDHDFMLQALAQAQFAGQEGEVPVGAIVVCDGQVIGHGRNACERLQDATAHAEILAIGDASRQRGSWRLEDCDLYVTLEPCPMCMGACLNARVRRVVFGAIEPKAGACGSSVDLRAPPGYNHHLEVLAGVHAEASTQLLKDFFRALRQRKRPPPRPETGPNPSSTH
jgi:tRNA(adenine34) deaminase